MPSELERRAADYEEAEAAFIQSVGERASFPRLSGLADATAHAAKAYEAEAYRALHAGETAWAPLAELTAAAEQITSLWIDLADAYAGRLVRGGNLDVRPTTHPAP